MTRRVPYPHYSRLHIALDMERCAMPLADLATSARSAEHRRAMLRAGLGDTAAGLLDARPGESDLYETVGGVALIRMNGALFDDDLILPRWGMSGYGGLMVQIEEAAADAAVRAILLLVDSPGGVYAPGLIELSERIHALRQDGVQIAVAIKGVAASAAYWIASAAGRIFIPAAGEAGSIGVWTAHVDMSKAFDDFGLKVTLIFSGAHKVDGHPFAALPDDVRAEWQAEVDEIRGRFAETVARNRGLDVAAVMATEARIYQDKKAVAAGLADGVATPRQVLDAMIEDAAKAA